LPPELFLGGQIFESNIFYRETEDNDEKTVERSPEPSGGNGGELDLLVRGEGMGDIEAGVPETGERGVEAEVGESGEDHDEESPERSDRTCS